MGTGDFLRLRSEGSRNEGAYLTSDVSSSEEINLSLSDQGALGNEQRPLKAADVSDIKAVETRRSGL